MRRSYRCRVHASRARARAGAPARGPRQLALRIPRSVTYDRARSRERRRRLAYSGPMPAHLVQSFTPTEVAVLRMVADEHRDRGGCDRSIDEIAARAGVCRRTVQNALCHAERLGLVSITERRIAGRRNLSNIVRIVSREWLAWIEHHSKTGARHGRTSVPAARHGGRDVAHGIGCTTVHGTEKLVLQSLWGAQGGRSEDPKQRLRQTMSVFIVPLSHIDLPTSRARARGRRS